MNRRSGFFYNVLGSKVMINTLHIDSPLGGILLAADHDGLVGRWFDGQKHFAGGLSNICIEGETPIIDETRRWLDIYFSGKNPDFTPPLKPQGTPFWRDIWNILLKIPYGETVSYGDITKEMERTMNMRKMAAQAVGTAVGSNRISIIIPCHRVIKADGSIGGYAGGVDKKEKLLALEGVCIKESNT